MAQAFLDSQLMAHDDAYATVDAMLQHASDIVALGVPGCDLAGQLVHIKDAPNPDLAGQLVHIKDSVCGLAWQ